MTIIEKNCFTDVIYCGLCGNMLKSHVVEKKNTKPVYNFKCGACNAKAITAAKLEKAVIEHISNIPATSYNVAISEREKTLTAALIEELNVRLGAIENRKSKITDDYIVEKLTLNKYRDFNRMLDIESKTIVKKINVLTPAEIKSVIAPKTKDEIITAFNENWSKFNDIEKQQFILKYIRKIIFVNHPKTNDKRCQGKCEIVNIEFNSQ